MLGFVVGLSAAEPDQLYKGSPEFERMKTLVGSWKGKADMGQGPMEFAVEYRLVSGGSAIEERIFAGTPKEMVTMYYDDRGKLRLTHFCMLANRPVPWCSSRRTETHSNSISTQRVVLPCNLRCTCTR